MSSSSVSVYSSSCSDNFFKGMVIAVIFIGDNFSNFVIFQLSNGGFQHIRIQDCCVISCCLITIITQPTPTWQWQLQHPQTLLYSSSSSDSWSPLSFHYFHLNSILPFHSIHFPFHSPPPPPPPRCAVLRGSVRVICSFRLCVGARFRVDIIIGALTRRNRSGSQRCYDKSSGWINLVFFMWSIPMPYYKLCCLLPPVDGCGCPVWWFQQVQIIRTNVRGWNHAMAINRTIADRKKCSVP